MKWFFPVFIALIACENAVDVNEMSTTENLNSQRTSLDDIDFQLVIEQPEDTTKLEEAYYQPQPLADTVSWPAYCLPIPTSRFLNWKNSDYDTKFGNVAYDTYQEDEIYYYLKMHLDSTENRITRTMHEEAGPIEWTQVFEHGIFYYHIEYVEIGAGGMLFTKCTDKRQFLQAIAPVIEEVVPDDDSYEANNVWRKDSTKYEPFDQGAGCHYEIKKDTLGYFMLDWYCGC